MKMPSLVRDPRAPIERSSYKPVVDLKSLARDLHPSPTTTDDPHDAIPPEARAYAPPSQRPDMVVEQVLRFGDLPTKELDDIIAAAEGEIAALKVDAQVIRDAYVKHTTRVVEDVKRLQSEIKLSMDLMHALRQQCNLLDTNASALADINYASRNEDV